MSTVINVTGVTPTPIIINGVGTVQQIIATGVITQRGEQGVPGPTGPAGTTDFNLLTNKPTLGTSAAKDIPATGNASAIEVVYGTDTRLTDSRPASDVSAWAKTPTKPTYTNTEVGAAATVHTHAISDTTNLQTSLDGKVDENAAITGATKTKITYDAKGLVTAGADATTADIADSTDKRYLTDAQLAVVSNTSGTNSGDNATNSQYSGLAASKQDKDATLTALAAYNTNGILTQTAADTFAGRTITGTTNQITVTNGDGVAGNPTLSLPQDIHTGASPTFAGVTVDSTQSGALDIKSSNPNAWSYLRNTGAFSTTNYTNLALQANSSTTANQNILAWVSRFANATHSSLTSSIQMNSFSNGVYSNRFSFYGDSMGMGGNVQPLTDSTYTLGTSSLYWKETYTDKLFLNSTATLDGSTAGIINITGALSPITSTAASGSNNAMYINTGATGNRASINLRGYNASNSGDFFTIEMRTDTNDTVMYAYDASTTTYNTLLNFNYITGVVAFSQNITIADAKNINVGTVTGTKIGTATNQKLGFYNATPVVRPSATPANATDLATALTLVNDLKSKLVTLGLIA